MRFSEVFELSERETVYLLIITIVFIFAASWVRVSSEVTYTDVSSYPVAVEHYGFPFDIMKKIYTYTNMTIISHGSIEHAGLVKSTIEFVPMGIMLDFLAYGTISFVIIKVTEKIMNEVEYYRRRD